LFEHARVHSAAQVRGHALTDPGHDEITRRDSERPEGGETEQHEEVRVEIARAEETTSLRALTEADIDEVAKRERHQLYRGGTEAEQKKRCGELLAIRPQERPQFAQYGVSACGVGGGWRGDDESSMVGGDASMCTV